MDERYGVGADGFAAADGAKALAGLGFDADLIDSHAKGSRKLLPHERDMRSEFGALEANRSVDVHDGVPGLSEQFASMAEKQEARHAPPLGRGVRKVLADITQCGSAQERVTNRMREGVSIGMAGRAAIEGNADAAQNQLATGRQTMDIVAEANTERRWRVKS